jgi:hypothetical protein
MASPSSHHVSPPSGLRRPIAFSSISPIFSGSNPLKRVLHAFFTSRAIFFTNSPKFFPVLVVLVAVVPVVVLAAVLVVLVVIVPVVVIVTVVAVVMVVAVVIIEKPPKEYYPKRPSSFCGPHSGHAKKKCFFFCS